VLDQFEVGDHVAFLLDVIETKGGETAMGFQQARRIEPGHEA
jgi:hypothetical protein